MNVPLDIKLQASEALEAALSARLAPLCSRVETELGKPAVILVTSAVDGDGKSATAHALAGCFTHRGCRAALVATRPGRPVYRSTAVVSLPDQNGKAIEQELLGKFIDGMRSSYDFTIVDAGTFLRSGTAVALARLVDGILLTVRVGRAPTDEDKLMLQTIEHSGGCIIGVVMASDAAVVEFGRREAGEWPAPGGSCAESSKRYSRVFRAAGKVLTGKPI